MSDDFFSRTGTHTSRKINRGRHSVEFLKRRRSPERITTPERMAVSKIGRRLGGQEPAWMESGEDGVPWLISRARDRISWRDAVGEQLLPAAGQGRRAISLWRAMTKFLASCDMPGSGGEDERDRAHTHSGQMGPPAKKLEW